MSQNYTPIDNLIEEYKKERAKAKQYSPFSSKESEPAPTILDKVGEVSKIPERKERIQKSESRKNNVSIRPENIKVSKDLQKIGVQPVKTGKFTYAQDIKLPISDDDVLKGLNKPITSSWRWLSTLSIYILRLAHLSLKKIHGKVRRVMTN